MVAVVDISRRIWPLSWFDRWRTVPAYGKTRRAIRLGARRYAETLGQEVSIISTKAPLQGRLLLYGGHALGWIAFTLMAYGLFTVTERDVAKVLLGPFGLGLVAHFIAAPMLSRGRRILQPTAAEVRTADLRRPVIFLRSFRDDDAEIIAHVDEDGKVATGRLEEALAPPFSPYGPLVAIGKPGEPLPRFGAARAYFGDADWKAAIARWMDEAVLLLVIPGLTKGLGWELERIAARGHGRKMLVVMPPPSGFLPWQGKVGYGWSFETGGNLGMSSSWEWQPKSNKTWNWNSDSDKGWNKGPTPQQQEIDQETLRQQRWANLRAAFVTVAGFADLPEKAPPGLIAMHLSTTGEPVLITGPEVPREADYVRAIAFAVYGMKVHGRW
jgi:hypothetical protein